MKKQQHLAAPAAAARGWANRALLAGPAALALGLFGTLTFAGDGAFPKDFGGDDRALLHLASDKPVYRPGEIVYARGLLLDVFRTTLKKQPIHCHMDVKSPKGDVVASGDMNLNDGVAPFSWPIPREQAGGEYTLLATFPWSGYPSAEMKFDVRSYRVPRLRTDLQFVRKGYGPGDEVTATLSAKRAEGGIPAGAQVTAIARVDGAEVFRGAATLDALGGCTVSFKLPAAIEDGDGSLALVIQDGGVTETAAKTLPILLNKVAIGFYPEGGELVAGLPNRVYLEARDTRKLPADVSGRVQDGDGKTVAAFATEHEGRGNWTFTPVAGAKYTVVLDKPAGNAQRFELPAVQATGFVLAAATDVFPAKAPVILRVGATAPARLRLALFKYEREIASIPVDLASGGQTVPVTLTPPTGADGVVRATLFDEEGNPRAERLLFRAPDRATRIKLTADRERSIPGGKVAVTVETTDETGRPIAAVVGLAVTDQSVLESIDKRDRAPRLPVQVLLGSDCRELADAEVYLAATPEAPRAVDLLLGTQGWRRFAYRDPEAFVKNHGDAARRGLALHVPTPPTFGAGRFGGRGQELRKGGVALAAAAPDEEGRPAPPQAPPAPRPDAAPAPDPGKGVPQAKAPAEQPVAGDLPVAAAEPPARPVADKKEMAEADEEFAGAAAGERADRRGRVAMKRMREAFTPYVRQYAHAARAGRTPDQRTDFAETLYWNAGLATDANGKATISFDLSDSITTFQVRADAVSAAGGLGEASVGVESRKPFYLEPKLPLEVTAGDLIEVPVSLSNGTADALDAALKAEIGAGIVREGAEPSLALRADSSGRLYLTLVAGKHNGDVAVKLLGAAGPFIDQVTRTIPVVPFGFPIEESFGGRLAGDAPATHVFTIPAGIEPTSLTARAIVYPSPLASLAEALAGLLREPCGCFEQTSSTAYPNLMVMRYFKSHHVDDPKLLSRASTLLDAGYKRLVGFECKEKGYEWFGGDPGHEALSAYGVLEFSDMSEVYPVDRTMLERTRQWLLARRDGKGGFTRNPRALDSFGGAPDDITNAYIVWSLLQAGEKGLEAEIEAVKRRTAESGDSYFLGLAANILLDVQSDAAAAVLSKLATKQEKDGCVRGAATSITRSGGECLEIETTSLAMLAWLRSPAHAANLEAAAKWLFERCKGGRFGSTQSTIMALRAVMGYDAARARPKAPGTVRLLVDGQEIGQTAFTPDTTGSLTLPDFASLLTAGEHRVELRMDGGAEMPYALDIRYSASKPANSAACKVRLATSLSGKEVKEGETIDLAVEMASLSKEGLPMAVAIVGLPGGLEARPDQLKELVKSGVVDFYETRGREVILYKRCLRPEESVKLTLSLVAAVPGRYTGPASRAYLYYTDGDKNWSEGLSVSVLRRD
ncbi:MAG: A-macroglobulin complement component [Planctomycetes bacterium]|nr:A-macroglobulin complement component [Planctomycetota bacterium]